ncbi:hypothetical protein UFOVP434_26 [uncultured Caudovirales phage]|uniref:Uncharacterized protein n=1 Tax=uncultured Caudovirales phage TaxID=2100421 RepID=A0A6J5M6L3_9CAUD|nr:hypothetical protein UFOVP434_26 [uncultured Caudovirales phage]
MTIKDLKKQLEKYEDEDIIQDASMHCIIGNRTSVYFTVISHKNGMEKYTGLTIRIDRS